MFYLNLDKDFDPFNTTVENRIRFHFASKSKKTLPGGEPYVKLLDKSLKFANMSLTNLQCIITHRIKSFNELGELIAAVQVLNKNFITKIGLFLPYFPGNKQDYKESYKEPFMLKVYADIINSLGFEFVTIFHPHSSVTPALIDNVETKSNFNFVKKALLDLNLNKEFNLVVPELSMANSSAILGRFLRHRGFDFNIVQCNKTRDKDNGKVTGVNVHDKNLKGKPSIIIINICDTGSYISEVSDALKAVNSGDVHLITSHGLFSKGTSELKSKFKSITTTDSFYSKKEEGIHVVTLNGELL